MLLQQVLEELSTHSHIHTEEEEGEGEEDELIAKGNPTHIITNYNQLQDIKHASINHNVINDSKHQFHINNHSLIEDSKYSNKVLQNHPPHYHKDNVIIDTTNHVITDCNHISQHTHKLIAANPIRSIDFKKKPAPVMRHTGSTNASLLYRAAIAAKQIQTSKSQSRVSAPALLANCLLSMISLSDEHELADRTEDNPALASHDGVDPPQAGRKTILKSFSQLIREEERKYGKDGLFNHKNSLFSNHKKLKIVSCCLFPSKRNVSSKTLGSTLELLHNSDELSSSNDGSNSRSRGRIIGRKGRAWVPGTWRSFMKRVFCKKNSGASTRSSVGDPIDMIFDDVDHQGLNAWDSAPLSNQDEVDLSFDKHHIKNYDHIEYMYNSSDSLLHVDNVAEGYNHRDLERAGRNGGVALEMRDGVAQEIMHEELSLSHDAPIASSFVFEQSCFSSFSSRSSTSHSMKLESSHPWLVSTCDGESCSTSPLHNVYNRSTNGNEPFASNGALLGMQDEIRKRFANKRLNLSR